MKESPNAMIIFLRQDPLWSPSSSVTVHILPLDLAAFFPATFAFIYIFAFCNLCSAKDNLNSSVAN